MALKILLFFEVFKLFSIAHVLAVPSLHDRFFYFTRHRFEITPKKVTRKCLMVNIDTHFVFVITQGEPKVCKRSFNFKKGLEKSKTNLH